MPSAAKSSPSPAPDADDVLPSNSYMVFRRKAIRVKSAKLTCVSDLHLGAPDIDLALLRRDLDRYPESDILLGGDLLDLIVPTDNKRYCPSNLHPRLQGCTDLSGALTEWLHELFKPYAHRIVFVGAGNHETEYLHRHHADPLAAFAYSLPHKPFYGGLCSWVLYDVCGEKFNLFYHHGYGRGGGAAPYSQFAQVLQRVEGADAVWMGHLHSPVTAKCRRLTPDEGLPLREIHFVRTGSYRQSYTRPVTQDELRRKGLARNYAATHLMQPQSMGAAFLHLDKKKGGGLDIKVEA